MTGALSLSGHKAEWLPLIRLRRAQLQKVAATRRDDPAFPWRAWARLVVNESLFLAGGVYQVDGDRQTWAAANAATALCYGRNAPFSLPSDVPPATMAECEAGAAKALAMGAHCLTTGEELGDKLGMTWELREQLKVWFIWPAGATQDDLAARVEARRAERRVKETAATREKRRAAGVKPREQYEAASIASRARAQGIKPDTLRARLRRAGFVPSNVASVSEPNNIGLLTPDRPATRGDTVAGQARALGLKPDTLRKRLIRAARKAAQEESHNRASAVDGNMHGAQHDPETVCAARPNAAQGRADALVRLAETLARPLEPLARMRRKLEAMQRRILLPAGISEMAKLCVSFRTHEQPN